MSYICCVNYVYKKILKDFNSTLRVDWVPDHKYETAYVELISESSDLVLGKSYRVNTIYKAILSKFELHKPIIRKLLAQLAKKKVLLNYHQKNELRRIVDDRNADELQIFISGLELNNEDVDFGEVDFMSNNEILESIWWHMNKSGKQKEILEALFSYYLFHSIPVEAAHKIQSNESEYRIKYFDYLQSIHDHKLERKISLVIIEITPDVISKFKKESHLTDYINTITKDYFKKLDNHCFLGVYYNGCAPWSVISNNILFAEKHIEETLVKGYFHPEKIAIETSAHINNLDTVKADFDIANSGFTYKDTYIIEDENTGSSYDSLVLFEKNERDETLIPCPACRSQKVRGNSYPILGVRSWECYNYICPDKSKYNRGKRYSLSSIIRQEAILDEKNIIPNEQIGEWRLDKVSNKSKAQVIEYVIKTYSLYGDNVEIVNGQELVKTINGRTVKYLPHHFTIENDISKFYDSSYFKRYVINSNNSKPKNIQTHETDGLHLMQGDSRAILTSFSDDFFEAAVTSPPYYNAREYSQWPNIYCYLYDMYNNAREVFRALKPGGIYLYNIFDYFDNERNVVFSAMGKKRMILGPYIVNMFERIGFKIEKNIIWYKGHIQGNRSFNQGNFVPYYQAPLNCYEHILVFRKPGSPLESKRLPNILNAKPVHKMVRGENILGHTAPFPFDIPNMLFETFPEGSRILDPYAGSFSTLRARGNRDFLVYGIERSPEYYQLGINLCERANSSEPINF